MAMGKPLCPKWQFHYTGMFTCPVCGEQHVPKDFALSVDESLGTVKSKRYRKRPVIVEAVQFDNVAANDPPGVFRREEDLSPYVVTIHGQRCYIAPGDWILPEPDGVHYYPVKPDIFEQTYEPVPDAWSES
jgi:hypothetical protein